MQPRQVLTTLAVFAVGAAGGVIGARLVPADVPLTPLAATPAAAGEIRIAVPGGQEDGIADLVDRVKVAVVNIDTVAHRTVPSQVDAFRYFFEGVPDGEPTQREEKGVGSGFVVAANGLIVTNHHVVRGADKLTVTFHDGKKYAGKVIGQDPGSDLALVKIDAKGLASLRLADPQRLRVGQYVVAMGSPLGLSQTVTTGILSAINRDIELNARVGFLQTDAPINPGNSGGPLLNLRGEVIGVNTAVAARGQGIGFAVPVDTLKSVLPQLEAKGRVDRPWLGVGIANLPEDRKRMFYPVDQGVLVGRIEPGGPAEAAGLQAGDVIQQLNGKTLSSANELIREVARHTPGEEVDLLVNRQGQTRSLKLKLQKMPEQAGNPAGRGQPDE
ncbi:MAG: trypsin-like peptidase domain-containing protein [Candidatus Sericytochromatia bacterium]|nr:trypsin-like peptidase domain-containing protein [Candidatus Sericytochromatia bacterium]